MTDLVTVAAGVALFGLGFCLDSTVVFVDARTRALRSLGAATVLLLVGRVVATEEILSPSFVGTAVSGAEFLRVVPFVICLVGVVAIALSDSISHRVDTLRRILHLLAIAIVFVGSTHPLILSACWVLSPFIVWLELRSQRELGGLARLFAIFQVPSVVLFLVALLLSEAGGVTVFAWLALVAIGIREAVFPGHTWFIRFVERAPMGIAVAFVAPQLGVYAHLELLVGTVPADLAHYVAGFGALTAVMAAILGVVQTSARRGLAYLMMSQTGLVAFGIEGTSEVALAGSLMAWQVLAVATTGFAMTLSALEARRGVLSLDGFTGCFSRTPRMAGGYLMMGLASVGFPLTLGFVAEDLLVQGSVREFPVLSLVLIVATAFNGMNVMRSFLHLFSGVRVHSGEADLTDREGWSLSAVLLVLVVGGMLPNAILTREFSPSDRALNRHSSSASEAVFESFEPEATANLESEQFSLASRDHPVQEPVWSESGASK